METIHDTDNPGETNIVPIFYVLLINKTKITYIKMFQKINESLPDFNLKKFILDFEEATMSAIEEVFPEAVVLYISKEVCTERRNHWDYWTTKKPRRMYECASVWHIFHSMK